MTELREKVKKLEEENKILKAASVKKEEVKAPVIAGISPGAGSVPDPSGEGKE